MNLLVGTDPFCVLFQLKVSQDDGVAVFQQVLVSTGYRRFSFPSNSKASGFEKKLLQKKV